MTQAEIDAAARQQIAFMFPCARGPEVMHPRFWSKVFVDARELSTILTLNK
jgi:hypothetical protein